MRQAADEPSADGITCIVTNHGQSCTLFGGEGRWISAGDNNVDLCPKLGNEPRKSLILPVGSAGLKCQVSINNETVLGEPMY
jgi:hypothetical protein